MLLTIYGPVADPREDARPLLGANSFIFMQFSTIFFKIIGWLLSSFDEFSTRLPPSLKAIRNTNFIENKEIIYIITIKLNQCKQNDVHPILYTPGVIKFDCLLYASRVTRNNVCFEVHSSTFVMSLLIALNSMVPKKDNCKSYKIQNNNCKSKVQLYISKEWL